MYLMNPMTGSVDTLKEWQKVFENCTPDEWGGETFEAAGLVEVVPNIEGQPDYDPSYGEWRPAED